jgi:hypothetical protein
MRPFLEGIYMKYLTLFIVMILINACKVETQTNTVSNANKVALQEDQIVIGTDNLSSEEMINFADELEQRQNENPDKFFEIVAGPAQSGSAILSRLSDDHLYPKQNFYILIGLGQKGRDFIIQKADFEAIYNIMGYLADKQFRVLINVHATAEHLKIAVEDSQTSVILWSSHGNTNGFYDYNKDKVPYDIFKNKHKNFYQFILSSCEGQIALNDFYRPTAIKTWAWEKFTDSVQLKTLLLSDAWSADYGRALVSSVSGISCTANGKKFVLMQEKTRIDLYGEPFAKLSDCTERVNSIKKNNVCLKGKEGVFSYNVHTLVRGQSYNNLEDCIK